MPPKKSGPIFKGRTRSVPLETWKLLSVKTEGLELSNKLEEWGAEVAARPAVTVLLTVRGTTGRIMGSRFVVRGSLFKASKASKSLIPAKAIWPEAEGDISVGLEILGQSLNFVNAEAKNTSLWMDLVGMTGTKFYKGATAMSIQEVEAIPALKEGAVVRVALYPLSTTLQCLPLSLRAVEELAGKWGVSANDLTFPAINLTDYWGSSSARVEYVPRENPGEKFGIAYIPLLEITGGLELDKVQYPYAFSLTTELCAIMAGMPPTCHVVVDEVRQKLAADAPPTELNELAAARKWPGPGKDPSPTKLKCLKLYHLFSKSGGRLDCSELTFCDFCDDFD